MNKKILGIVIVIFAAFIGSYVANHFLNKGSSFDSTLMEVSASVNKQCPIAIDKETRLDTTIAGPEKSFTYFYTLVNYQKEELDSKTLTENLKPNLINNIKTNKDMKPFKENKVKITYVYKDKVGNEVMRILIKPNDYL
ncbi:MAG: hypothetical protein GY710_19375 [Desulfobacteraceae bacterium]|nr:hypothetical protein [Desulfobacteraceae bacterium]